MALLKFESVTFSYTQSPVLNDLTFTISPGELVGYLGVNGAGKTTTFLLATGLLRPEKGTVSILDSDPAATRSWTYQVGAMMSGAGMYHRLTVRRNLSFFAELYALKVDLDSHMRRHGLAEYADKPAGHLSQGYRRRLALARATLNSPKLLLLDEPADGLDPAATDHLHRFLREFRDRGGGVMLTSHRLEEVERLCDRVILLDRGAARLEGEPRDLLEQGAGLRDLVLKLQSEQGAVQD